MAEQIYKEAFDEAMLSLENEYKLNGNEDVFQLWFKTNIEYVEDTLDTITVSCKNIFMQKISNKKGYINLIKDKICELTGQTDLNIKCIVREDNLELSSSENNDEPNYQKNIENAVSSNNETYESQPSTENADSETLSSSENIEEDIPVKPGFKKHPLLKSNFTFDTFISGENSELPYKASIAVSNNPGRLYNPLLIYGGSGLGKTHLMQAIGNYIYNNSKEDVKIYYGTAESFLNEFTSAIKDQNVPAFTNKFRNLDLLLLDDIHFLDGKKGCQEQLFFTFEALHQKNAQMVFTCDRPLSEIKSMTERLVTRLSNGMYIDITIPNYETRIAILNKKISDMGKTLDPKVIDYIAKNIESNVRELESALNKVLGYAELMGQNPSVDICKNILKDILSSNNNDFVTIDVIQKVISENYQISVSDLKSKKKDKKYTIPRQIAYYISRELLDLPYADIGSEFGGKDHTTVIYACGKIEEKIKIDSNLNSKIKILIKEIKEYKKDNL